MPFTILVTANVFIASLLFNECPLPMLNIFHPIAIVGVACWVLHFTLAVALAKDEVTFVGGASTGKMISMTMIIPLQEFTTVKVTCKSSFNSLGATESLHRVIS